MLSMGRSKPWPEAMEALTGQREMKADAILEYFQPLMEWLEKTNEGNGDVIGWESPTGKPILCALCISVCLFVVSSCYSCMRSRACAYVCVRTCSGGSRICQ